MSCDRYMAVIMRSRGYSLFCIRDKRMRKNHIFGFVIFCFCMVCCSTSFAQYNVDDIIRHAEQSSPNVVPHNYIDFKVDNWLVDDDKTSDSVKKNPYSMYNLLNGGEKWVYDKIYPAVLTAKLSFTVPYDTPAGHINSDSVMNVMIAMIADHPEFVWLTAGFDYSKRIINEQKSLRITFDYNSLSDEPERYRKEFEAEAKKMKEEKDFTRPGKICL